jgi:hypothetical protein
LPHDQEALCLRIEEVVAGVVDERRDRLGLADREDRRCDRAFTEAGDERLLEPECVDQCGDVVGEKREGDRLAAGVRGVCATARVGRDDAEPARERVQVGRVRDRDAGPAQAARDEPAVQEQKRPAGSPLELVNVDPVCTDHVPVLNHGFHGPSVGAELAPVDPAFAGSFAYG